MSVHIKVCVEFAGQAFTLAEGDIYADPSISDAEMYRQVADTLRESADYVESYAQADRPL